LTAAMLVYDLVAPMAVKWAGDSAVWSASLLAASTAAMLEIGWVVHLAASSADYWAD
jgi:hypothetical protein